MKKVNEYEITFTTVKKGANSETRVFVNGWEGGLSESGVEYDVPVPLRSYVVRFAMAAGPLYDGFTLQEVEPGVFEFELKSERLAAEAAKRAAEAEGAQAQGERIRKEEYHAGLKAALIRMKDYIQYRLGYSLEELEKHLPEIRRIIGDPEPDPQRRGQRRGQGRGERR